MKVMNDYTIHMELSNELHAALQDQNWAAVGLQSVELIL